MNQKARQQANFSVEKDLHKLLNNSNFGIDSRNNIDHCIVEPLYDDIMKFRTLKHLEALARRDIKISKTQNF